MANESIMLTTQAGHAIAVNIFQAKNPKAVVIVAGAIGVPQYNYTRFSQWLVEQGYAVVTFDYHGMGASIGNGVKHCHSDILGWAQYDCPAVIELACSLSTNSKLLWIGHSVGGQIIGMLPAPAHTQLHKVITIASGSGYWLENAWPTKRIVWGLWFLIVPLSLRLCGYFPGNRLNVVGDLPKSVMQQWRRWCLNPEYVVGAEGEHMRKKYASVTAPITSLSFTDDEMMSEKSINSLHGFYQNSAKTMIRISPQDLGLKHIGHLGWFRQKFKNSLWKNHILAALQD